ncbi:hypothetical protein DFJ63DRAFT_314394 [Scheffersomyces coipomensis]|uniref:uncharacterized protein n=1 Tax=Scheffersomyces coipomensis TaxID=1788519 RepID=UPI00315D6884
MNSIRYNYQTQQPLLNDRYYMIHVMTKQGDKLRDMKGSRMKTILKTTMFWPKNAYIIFYIIINIHNKEEEQDISNAINSIIDIKQRFPDRPILFSFGINRYYAPDEIPDNLCIPDKIHEIKLYKLRISNFYSSGGVVNVTTNTMTYNKPYPTSSILGVYA